MGTHDISSPSLVHPVLGHPIGKEPAADEQVVLLALGCFWGAEKALWKTPGVVATAVGYTAGVTPQPTYHAVCSGRTGHTEAVRVVFRPGTISFDDLLRVFFEAHDPTQGNRQGNDIGTQYRSGIYTTSPEQLTVAVASLRKYEKALLAAGRGPITTEVEPAGPFWFAEEYHQQYLHKNPQGYCGLGGCGVPFPIG